jgi:hypothetical protein
MDDGNKPGCTLCRVFRTAAVFAVGFVVGLVYGAAR